jgi:hypothetical protein
MVCSMNVSPHKAAFQIQGGMGPAPRKAGRGVGAPTVEERRGIAMSSEEKDYRAGSNIMFDAYHRDEIVQYMGRGRKSRWTGDE